ncbi:multisubunit potassium/proton antiporter, PhaE subunit [Roseovarius litoreus]|jgi:multicomponent K+:H+ antiporter subunit E|uniref:Multisubunit potassium/proton antiporter, PhaE subunit n=1 Tax=Roseovarius litoreus TaxID=1155722 RepID=A0A1M7CRF4_9RHOB|nr:Na+/H+ antiporter subunit E [Roseovarius litoreus]SHL69747.1 multisubunit potassium/proton antiporter, PhaE subunit [Roseovarius litoreus]
MIRFIFPHPLLSVALTLIWLALVNKVTPGNVLLGAILGVVVPILTAPYWPHRAKVKNPLKIIEYVLIVLWDIVVANVEVALIILFKRNRDLRSQWIMVPLELTSPEAITVLAGTITMTPGTVSAMLSADSGSLLVHCLHTDDPDGVRDQIKSRYERRLMEIFQ